MKPHAYIQSYLNHEAHDQRRPATQPDSERHLNATCATARHRDIETRGIPDRKLPFPLRDNSI